MDEITAEQPTFVPWESVDGYAHGYPERIVDHAEERLEALDRYERIKR